ncbi:MULTISPECIES: succinate dehydrogenase/fumarate reductase iron-sulfur subunit [unclassified Nitratiruptor]|uniref:succinate dehydrogenase/fumarate reductase iron-sulfur subunit n=1 Tax=unclassified Nitratiruptor TaxID=2624044 RepID=UPI00191579D6|nr:MULTISPECIES: 2Fe-2S iron-sulfur cluster-binding protein [unclassified Nitratiruptor]BCD59278.1 fumarate reductase iron-sulfur subunit [Nitratiruptor sp. YY08-10]BCD63202.1 fumarate reductase iron-sulfur subunit [Nitratiruptor sp. YY08-14]
MKIKVQRYHPQFEPPSIDMEYEIPKDLTLLESLEYIKKEKDRTLTFSCMCRSGVCGSCAVRVNGKEVLACEYKPNDGDFVEPLKNSDVIRDLVTDMEKPLKRLISAKAYPLAMQQKEIDEREIEKIERQSDCILCQSCYSSCPVYETNDSFLGPFALTRAYRYVVDAREEAKKEHIDAVVQNGIWDCTLCGNCTIVCPQGIDPKNDILMLQSWAAKFGYTNPTMGSFGSFGLEF